MLLIRSHSWGAATISWSVVIEELLHSAKQMGHKSLFISTNGYEGMRYWSPETGMRDELEQREIIRAGNAFDIDLTYTIPQNFSQRFLPNSKCRMAIYAYESSVMPERWKQFYSLVDYVLPPSSYCAEMIKRNGCPEHKIKVVPHGIDLNVFNPETKPLPLPTNKKFKFLCVSEPHYRKQLDRLLAVYCENFTASDDVCLVLKTKLFTTPESMAKKHGFEMDLRPVLSDLKKKYGDKMPEIKLVTTRLKNIASLYAACDAFVLMTASEGWGIPFLEALAMGKPVVAPRFGGQLEFLSDLNSILTKCGVRKSRPQEIYWGGPIQSTVGSPDEKDFGNKMRWLYQYHNAEEHKPFFDNMRKAGLETAQKFTWQNAMRQIISIAQEHKKGD